MNKRIADSRIFSRAFERVWVVFLLGAIWTSPAQADVKLNSLFADHAVLQREAELPIWGTARDGEEVTVEFAGQSVSTVAQRGEWQLRLKPLAANASPQALTVRGDNTVTLQDVVVGDVWIASGQSNMARRLGNQGVQRPIENCEAEVTAANYPLIRQYSVPKRRSATTMQDAGGQWRVCSPENVVDFSAVGYFFARDVHVATKLPIGVLFAAWGGTRAEAWTSASGLSVFPEFGDELALLDRSIRDPDGVRQEIEKQQEMWYQRNDMGSDVGNPWSQVTLATTDWRRVTLPNRFEDLGYSNYDGVMWFRRTFRLPERWDGSDAEICLGKIDDNDSTWVNGQKVGSTAGYDQARRYLAPSSTLRRGTNVVAIRVLDTGGDGGLTSRSEPIRIECQTDVGLETLPLDGAWLSKAGGKLQDTGFPPPNYNASPSSPTVLYNAMIAPLQRFPIKGVIWYQGESNNGKPRQYRKLFPNMIADWRAGWGRGDFPFLFVQIAPHRSISPELREAQFLTLQRASNTAMAVTTDVGDASDIHPTRKGPVGARLALAARALAYAEDVEYSGPLYESVAFSDGKATLEFTHAGGGLETRGEKLLGFTIAGAEQHFVTANAEIHGRSVVVWSEDVPVPVAVRYGWSNVPDVNLYNNLGLPASPFRTDVNQAAER